MKSLQKIFILFFAIFSILVLHIFIINYLPFPYSYLNIVFAILFFSLTITPKRQLIWSAIIISYFLELLSGIPFGIGITSLIASLLIINWFQLNVITNRSTYIIFLSAILGMILYRTLFFILIAIYNSFLNRPALPQKEIIVDMGWEILFSSLLVLVLYFIYTKLIPSFHRNYRRNF